MPGLAIQLIVGLGNPGREYETTRHNAGFWVMDELAVRHGGVFRHEPRFAADVARTRIADQDCWLVKPQDYMNNSGRVSAAVASFYKIEAAAMLVVHDELDLPPAELRLKFGGGAGGHNGLKNLIQHFGEGFWRLRVGIGHPGEREKVNPWLLNSTTRVERADLELAIPMAADIVPVLLEEGAERAMQQLHSQSAMGSD
jgi:PTH1 family peptidyl-tRNA hydrolase